MKRFFNHLSFLFLLLISISPSRGYFSKETYSALFCKKLKHFTLQKIPLKSLGIGIVVVSILYQGYKKRKEYFSNPRSLAISQTKSESLAIWKNFIDKEHYVDACYLRDIIPNTDTHLQKEYLDRPCLLEDFEKLIYFLHIIGAISETTSLSKLLLSKKLCRQTAEEVAVFIKNKISTGNNRKLATSFQYRSIKKALGNQDVHEELVHVFRQNNLKKRKIDFFNIDCTDIYTRRNSWRYDFIATNTPVNSTHTELLEEIEKNHGKDTREDIHHHLLKKRLSKKKFRWLDEIITADSREAKCSILSLYKIQAFFFDISLLQNQSSWSVQNRLYRLSHEIKI